MPVKQHFSPVTNKWVRCTATKRPCRYNSHRETNFSISEAEKNELFTEVVVQTPPHSFTLRGTDDKNNIMTVAAEGSSGLKCLNCEKSFPQPEANILRNGDASAVVRCEHCGNETSWLDAEWYAPPFITEIQRESVPIMMNPELARQQHWFHGTTVTNWVEEIKKAEVFIHAGSKSTAEARLRTQISYVDLNEEIFIYEMRIKPEAVITSQVMWDDNTFPEVIEPETDVPEKNVTLYVNRWEEAGSISIISDINNFEIVNIHKVVKSKPSKDGSESFKPAGTIL